MKPRFEILMRFLVVILGTSILVGCSNPSNNSANSGGDVKSKISCAGDGKFGADGLGGIAYNFDCKVPDFPTKIKDYVLDQTVENETIRVFEGESWRPFLTPYRDGNTMSCQPEIWVVRWRSQNPNVKLQISGAYGGFEVGNPTDSFGEPITDGSFDQDSDWVAFYEPEKFITGSAGYESGQSCYQPLIKWDSNSAGNANLVDISFEYQIWKYKQEI